MHNKIHTYFEYINKYEYFMTTYENLILIRTHLLGYKMSI